MTFLSKRRAAAEEAWGLREEVVLVAAGEEVRMPGRGDQAWPFRAHPEYFWLADRERPGCVLAFDPGEGWTDFVPEPSAQARVWSGDPPVEGTPASDLPAWLEARRGRPLAVLGCPLPGRRGDPDLTRRLRRALTGLRRPKDEEEVRRMREAIAATAAGYERLRDVLRPGVSERAVQIEVEAAMFRAGGDRTAYETIVASGPRSAVLHAPATGREVAAGELVLVDAGVEVRGYAADLTRTWPASGRFTPEQSDLHAVVLEAQAAAIACCRAGEEFREAHRAASIVIARGLVDFGLLRGAPDSLVEGGAASLFLPHGVGHLVGLGVRDAGPALEAPSRPRPPGLEHLRLDLPLLEGEVVTIEPGIYLVPALLEDPRRRERHREEVDWDRAARMRAFGGIRIEDDVRVGRDGPEVLTALIPKLPDLPRG